MTSSTSRSSPHPCMTTTTPGSESTASRGPKSETSVASTRRTPLSSAYLQERRAWVVGSFANELGVEADRTGGRPATTGRREPIPARYQLRRVWRRHAQPWQLRGIEFRCEPDRRPTLSSESLRKSGTEIQPVPTGGRQSETGTDQPACLPPEPYIAGNRTPLGAPPFGTTGPMGASRAQPRATRPRDPSGQIGIVMCECRQRRGSPSAWNCNDVPTGTVRQRPCLSANTSSKPPSRACISRHCLRSSTSSHRPCDGERRGRRRPWPVRRRLPENALPMHRITGISRWPTPLSGYPTTSHARRLSDTLRTRVARLPERREACRTNLHRLRRPQSSWRR